MSPQTIRTSLLTSAAMLSLAAAGHGAVVLNEGFEAAEGYTTGNLIDQKGWVAEGGSYGDARKNNVKVIDAATDGLTAPAGTRVAKITLGSGDTRGSKAFSDTAINTGDITITSYMAYDEVGAANITAWLYIGDISTSTNGAVFGFKNDGTNVKFMYRKDNAGTDTVLPLQPGVQNPEEKTFYKFVTTIHTNNTAAAKYDLSVYDLNNTLLGSVTNVGMKGNLESFRFVNFTVVGNNSGANGDVMYFDAVSIPEPASVALPLIGVMGLSRRWRK